MEKVINHGNRKEKGLTLVETIIALAIITTVSLATVSIVVYSSNALRNTAVKAFFNHETDTLSNIYLSYHDDADSYGKAMKQYSGAEVTLGEDRSLYYDGKFNHTAVETSMYALLLDFDADRLLLKVSDNNGKSIMDKEARA